MKLMKMFRKYGPVAVLSTLVTTPAFALDTLAATTAITAAITDVETVAVAVIGAAAVLFGISKIRQVIKA